MRFWILDFGLGDARWGFVAVLTLAALSGCKSAPKNGDAPAPVAPSYQEIAAFHNARVQKLQTTYSNGIIWSDEKGQLLEQGNIELWIDLPAKTALRVEKLGEVLLWLGSNEHGFWLFDRRNKDARVLYTGGHAEHIALEEDSPLTFRPLALIDLMGLAVLPTQEHSPEVAYDVKSNSWVVQTHGRGGLMRTSFDRQTLLPNRVESLTERGEVAISSTLSRYESVELPEVGIPAWPKLAELIDITGHAENQSGETTRRTVRIAINQTTADFDRSVLERLFDLERLMRAMRSDRVEGEVP